MSMVSGPRALRYCCVILISRLYSDSMDMDERLTSLYIYIESLTFMEYAERKLKFCDL